MAGMQLRHQNSWTPLLSRSTSSSSLAADELLKLFDEETTDRCWSNFGWCLDAIAIEGTSSELPRKPEMSAGANVTERKHREVSKSGKQRQFKHGIKRLKLPKLKRERHKEVRAQEEPIAKRTRRQSSGQEEVEQSESATSVEQRFPKISTPIFSGIIPARHRQKQNKLALRKGRKLLIDVHILYELQQQTNPSPVNCQSYIRNRISSIIRKLYCICQTPDHELYVGCDGCNGWFHPQCVGISQREAEEMNEYFCPKCVRARKA